jgi:hypothetical protein
VLDLLASEFGARIGVDCLTEAARWGHDAMIDHLVEEYGVDPNKSDGYEGCTALHYAAMSPYDADALVSWFESGVGHRVWRTVRREHPHVLDPTLLPRRQENMSKAATGRKPARSTGPVRPTLNGGGSRGHIKASKPRQRQAAMDKALKDAVWYV